MGLYLSGCFWGACARVCAYIRESLHTVVRKTQKVSTQFNLPFFMPFFVNISDFRVTWGELTLGISQGFRGLILWGLILRVQWYDDV